MLSTQPRSPTDRNHLSPEDALSSPTRHFSQHHLDVGGLKPSAARRRKERDRRRSRKRKEGTWKKLLWVRQSYPDNYTDPPTFLSHLQRNPRFQLYDFWPLVADSTVIVQHVCSVAIFVCCFVGIYQEKVSPISVVSWGNTAAILGWAIIDMWIGQDEKAQSKPAEDSIDEVPTGLGLTLPKEHSHNAGSHGGVSPTLPHSPMAPPHSPLYAPNTPMYTVPSIFSPRNQQRIATAKSAILIYCALLGLSPILESLTKSTTIDSIWAMSTWLMGINVFFFDYSGGVGAKFPASLSTNAALMASTVLASRLPSTTHVFSLTLFSIEVFGLFPVFRRHLLHRSWPLHVLLTVSLIVGAGAGLGIMLYEDASWRAAITGVVVWGLGNALAMGGCSWWLIGLQRYKNVVIGPWDPARPIIRAGGWE